MSSVPYQTEPFTLTQNQIAALGALVDSFAIISATYGDYIEISTGTSGSFFPFPADGQLDFAEPTQVYVKNTNASANTITIGSGSAKFRRYLSAGGTVVVLGTVTVTAAAGGLIAVGAAAHDAPVSLAPVLQGLEARSSERAAVSAAGDVVRQAADMVGKAIVLPYANPENQWSYPAAASGIVNSSTAVTAKAAASGVLRNYVTGLQLMAEALGTATEFAIRDGAGGTVLWRTKIPTGGQPLINITFPVPLKGTAATLLEIVTLTASGTGAVYADLQGYVGY